MIHNSTVYLSGQVGNAESDITKQTEETLAKIEALLAKANTDKSNLLQATIWLKDISRDFAAMNAVWNAWVVPGAKPVRCCGESRLARDGLLVEIIVTAAQ